MTRSRRARCCAGSTAPVASGPKLALALRGSPAAAWSPAELRKMGGVRVVVEDPHEHSALELEGVPAKAVFDAAFGPAWKSEEEVVAIDHGEIGDHGDQYVLDALIVQCARQMMMVDDIMELARSHVHRDHMPAEKLSLFFLRLVLLPILLQALALVLDLDHSDRHLGRAQREDWNRLQDRFARIRHDRNS